METVKHEVEASDLKELVSELVQNWLERLANDCPEQSNANRESIIRWLLGDNLDKFNTLNSTEGKIVQQAMEYRYRILRQRYLGLRPEQAYHQLLRRLSSLTVLRHKIFAWVALCRQQEWTVSDILQEVLQEMLHSDRYMQRQLEWSAQCTTEKKLRHALLFASLEEYCLRPIQHQPLLLYRTLSYLQRTARQGLTQVPNGQAVQTVSDERLRADRTQILSLIDIQMMAEYQDWQIIHEQQALGTVVQEKLELYLAKRLGAKAAKWLQLYLQGWSQKEIASRLNLSISEVYRLREKISYHARSVFALKHESELIDNWLNT